jgi:hypothetical protein
MDIGGAPQMDIGGAPHMDRWGTTDGYRWDATDGYVMDRWATTDTYEGWAHAIFRLIRSQLSQLFFLILLHSAGPLCAFKQNYREKMSRLCQLRAGNFGRIGNLIRKSAEFEEQS